MKKISQLKILASFLLLYNADAQNVEPTPLSVTIQGEVDLAEGFSADYTAPGNGGVPGYTYQWSIPADTKGYFDGHTLTGPTNYINDDAYLKVEAQSRDTGVTDPTTVTIKTKITDTASPKVSVEDSFNITIHEVYEVVNDNTKTKVVNRTADQYILCTGTLHSWANTFNVAVEASGTWTVGIDPSLAIGLSKVIEFTADLKVEHTWIAGTIVTQPVAIPAGKQCEDDVAGVTIQCFSYPIATEKGGTWTQWGVGKVGTGDWTGGTEKSIGFDSKIVSGSFVDIPSP